jgi:hypothetical protein
MRLQAHCTHGPEFCFFSLVQRSHRQLSQSSICLKNSRATKALQSTNNNSKQCEIGNGNSPYLIDRSQANTGAAHLELNNVQWATSPYNRRENSYLYTTKGKARKRGTRTFTWLSFLLGVLIQLPLVKHVARFLFHHIPPSRSLQHSVSALPE